MPMPLVVYFIFCMNVRILILYFYHIRRGDLTEGFFALPFWGAYIWRGLYMEGLTFGIYGIINAGYWIHFENRKS